MDQGPVGDFKARNLIRWAEHGKGGVEIAWGTPGDFDRCVALISAHAHDMTPEEIKGYCANRHHAVLGFWPATHAKLDRAAGRTARQMMSRRK